MRRAAAMALGEGKLEVVLGQKSCSKPKDGRLQSSKRLRLATLAPWRRATAVVVRAARCLLVLPPPPLVPLVCNRGTAVAVMRARGSVPCALVHYYGGSWCQYAAATAPQRAALRWWRAAHSGPAPPKTVKKLPLRGQRHHY